MVEDESRPQRCLFCNSSFSVEILNKIKDDKDDVYCENCGDLIKRVRNKYNFNPPEILEIEAKTKIKDIPVSPQKELKPNPDALHYPIGRIFYDTDFPLIFKSNFIIVFSRQICFSALRLEREGQIQLGEPYVPENAINDLYMSTRHIQDMRIQPEFLNNLHEISKDEFERNLKQLQAKIQSNSQYLEDFHVYSRWLIRRVYLIMHNKWDDDKPNKFERTIKDDLNSSNILQLNVLTPIDFEDFEKSVKVKKKEGNLTTINEIKAIIKFIRYIEKSENPTKNEIKQQKLIANPDKYEKMKKLAIEQLKHFHTVGKKKYSNKEMMNEIGYYDRERLKNSIIRLIGSQILYKKFFTKKGSEPKYTLEDLIETAANVGQERMGVPGIITKIGAEIYQAEISKGIGPSQAYTQVWCQNQNHEPFRIRFNHLLEGIYCRRCSGDKQANSYEKTIQIGIRCGFILKENEKSYGKKIIERGKKRPVDVKLEWECIGCGNRHSRSTQSLENPKTGCKICAAKNLEITKERSMEIGKIKGLKLDMTDAEFEIAKEKMRKKGLSVTLAELKWIEAGKSVNYSYAYVYRARPGSFKYKNIYNSPTGHPSSAEENEGRLLLESIFGVKFDHTYLREIVGDEIEIKSGIIRNIHNRSHVDGFNIVRVNSKKYEVAYEFREMYWHSKYLTRKRDIFKHEVINAKGGIVFLILNDHMEKKLWAQIITEQFKIQTGVSIHSLIPQKSLNLWLKTKKDI
jgi:transcription elongation factor Elf1